MIGDVAAVPIAGSRQRLFWLASGAIQLQVAQGWGRHWSVSPAPHRHSSVSVNSSIVASRDP